MTKYIDKGVKKSAVHKKTQLYKYLNQRSFFLVCVEPTIAHT